MPIKQLDLISCRKLRKTEVAAKRRVLSKVLEGSWIALLKGRGMEFAGFRPYTYGDDASRIDWNATLRAKEVLVREFEEYKTVNVFFLLDISDSMLFTSQKKLKCEYAAEMMFNLATAIVRRGRQRRLRPVHGPRRGETAPGTRSRRHLPARPGPQRRPELRRETRFQTSDAPRQQPPP